MNKIERIIVRIWGHSNDVFGLLIIPTIIFTLMIAGLVLFLPEKKLFFFGVWYMAGIVQVIGVLTALRIRTRQTK